MAGKRMLDAFFSERVSLLPPEEPEGREGGRPSVAHCDVIKVVWCVLGPGWRWKHRPALHG